MAYADVFKIGHENYRAGLLDPMKRGSVSGDEQPARMPTATFRDRMTVYFGGKELQRVASRNSESRSSCGVDCDVTASKDAFVSSFTWIDG